MSEKEINNMQEETDESNSQNSQEDKTQNNENIQEIKEEEIQENKVVEQKKNQLEEEEDNQDQEIGKQSISKSQQNLNQSYMNKITPLKTPGKLSKSKILRPQENRQRLIVEKIILQDFKSYAGKKVIGPFHKCFTSVVGPNGSGKSNLIESLLFVFAKRANQMRLKQLHQLIHNSGQENTPTKASVEVHFSEIKDKDNDDFEVIPGTKFTVKRTVNKSSQTHYEINGSKVKQEEVTDLLKNKGIDLNNNRFLILQGEVEQISQMKPKTGDPDRPGLLEYLEDIIGSNQYKEKIEENEEQYEIQNDQRREKGERMRLTEKDLEKLNDSKNTAIDYIRREKNIYSIENILNQVQRFNSTNELVRLEKIVEDLYTETKNKKQEFKEKIQENKQILLEWKKKREELEEIRALVNNSKAKFQKLQEDDEKYQQDVKFETENQVKLEAKREELEKEYSKILDDDKEMKKELPLKEKKYAEITKEKEELEAECQAMMAEITSKNQKLVKAKKDLQIQLQGPTNKVKNLKQQLSVFESKIKILQQEEQNQGEGVQKYHDEINKNKQEIQQAAEVINQVKQAQQRMKEVVEEFYQQLQVQDNETQNLRQRQNEFQQQLNQNKNQVNESNQRNKIVNDLLTAQNNGELQGVYGRLGDLGAIDQRYDVAITTACGALDNIVVQSQEDGQRCIQYLRERKLGRANFIPINTMKNDLGQRCTQGFQAPGNSQRLFDLIQIKNENLRPVFYYALRDTLVCQDIDEATKIGYGSYGQRMRCVTIDGKLIETSGVMSGGGKPKKGGMGNQIHQGMSQNDLNRLRNECQQLEHQIEQCRQKSNQIREQIKSTNADETAARAVLQERQQDIDIKTQQIQDCERRIQNYQKQQNARKDNQQEIEVLTQKIQQKIEEIEKIEQKCQVDRDALEQIEEQLKSQGGDEYKEKEQILNSTKKRHTKIENETNEIASKIANIDKNLARVEKEKEKVKNNLAKVEKKLEGLKIKQKELEDVAMKVLQEMKAQQDKQSEMEIQQAQKDERKNDLDKLINSMKADLDKMKAEIQQGETNKEKKKHEINKVNEIITKKRQDYQSITEQYDFLQELDEIANFSTDPDAVPGSKDNGEDQDQNGEQAENQMEEEEESEESNQIQSQKKRKEEEIRSNKKKRQNMGTDISKYIKRDITDDFTNEELEECNAKIDSLQYKLRVEEQKLNNLKEDTNIETINEFMGKYKEYKEKKKAFEEIKQKLETIKNEMESLKKLRFDEFMVGFNKISQKLKETYQTLTQGGDAELELIDSLDPFSDGVNFTVRPPKKSWKQIGKLSGGEKTLSSLSLIFALHYYKPTPLYFMDEIDAALDFKNVSVVGHYVKERTKDAQFIIISLRNNMFELAKKLVGVYKTFDQTKTIAIMPQKVQARLDEMKQQKKLKQQQDLEIEENNENRIEDVE